MTAASTKMGKSESMEKEDFLFLVEKFATDGSDMSDDNFPARRAK